MSFRLPLLLTLALVLISGGLVFAQQTPRAPQAPPAQQPPQAPQAPPSPMSPPAPPVPDAPPMPPDAPRNFTFFINGGNFLGVSPEEVDKENMNRYGLREARGVAIRSVAEGSPAERAGLKKDDVILRFDGEQVTTVRKLNRLIEEAAAGQTVRLTISRNGTEQEISVTLGSHKVGDGAMPHVFKMTPQADGGFGAPLAPGSPPRTFMYSFGASRRVGLSLMPLTKQLADYFGVAGGHGLLVASVKENGAAAKAGVRAGDVVTEVDGKSVEGAFDLMRVLGNKEQGDVTLTIIRDKAQQTIRVTPERGGAGSGDDDPSTLLPLMGFPPTVGELMLPEMNLKTLPQMDFVMPKLEMNLQKLDRLQNFQFPVLKMNKRMLPSIKTLPKVNIAPSPTIML